MPRTTAVCVLTFVTLAGLPASFARADDAAKAPATAGAVDLRPKFQAGQTAKFTQRIDRADTMSLNTAGQPGAEKSEAPPVMRQTTRIDHTLEYTLKVESASPEGTTLTIELTGVKAAAELRRGKFEWDSASPPDDKDAENPVIAAFKPIVGSVTRLILDKDGRITDVTPDPRLRVGSNPEFASVVQALTMSEPIKARWAPILSIKDGQEPAAVGSSWTEVTEIANQAIGRFEQTLTSTLKSVEGDTATIGIVGDLKLLPFAADKPAQGSLSDIKIAGSAKWDAKAGMIAEHEFSQQSTINISAGGIPVVRTTELKVQTKRGG